MSEADSITSRFGAASAQSAATPSISAARVAEVSARRDAVAERATAHFEQHRATWTNRQYGELLARDGERRALRPNGIADDRKAHLQHAADNLVRHRHAKRVATIHRVADRMMGRGEREGR